MSQRHKYGKEEFILWDMLIGVDMDILFEIVFDLVFEGCFELSSNRKVPKWIRYPLTVLISLFFIFVIAMLVGFGIVLFSESVLIGLLFEGLAVFILIGSIVKFRKIYLSRK